MNLISPYPHRMGGHCGSGALRDLMEWRGLGWGGPPTEGLVFALSGALDTSYVRSRNLLPPVYLVGRGGDLEIDLPERLGATVAMRSTDDDNEGWEWVRTSVDAGRPVLLWGDISELPYLRVRLQMSRHDIVVIGYDDERIVAHVVDNDREEVQEVPYDALRRARSSTAFPVPTRNTVYDIEWPSDVPPLAQAAAAAFRQAASSATSTTGSAIVPLGDGEVHANGLAAVSLFADDIQHWGAEFSTEELHVVLLGLSAFIEKAGTGGGLFRRLLANGAGHIAQVEGDQAPDRLSVVAHQCSSAWSAVAREAAAKDVEPATRLAGAAAAAARLPDLERQLVRELASAADSLEKR